MIEKVVFMNMCMISDNKGNVLALDKVGKNYSGNHTYQKLTNAACYYGYNFDELAHDSLEDVKATLVVYNAIKKKLPPYVWMSTQLLNKEKEVIFESDDVTEVIDKAKELFGQCERNMINNHIKSGLNFEHFIC